MSTDDLAARLASMIAERAAAHAGGTFLVGVAGGVAVGKSTLAQTLADGLEAPVQIVATDGFLRSNGDLGAAGLRHRKGFPESFDVAAFHGFLDALAAGRGAAIPVYSHVAYDVTPGETRAVAAGGVVIVEGVNVLQTPQARARFHVQFGDDGVHDPPHTGQSGSPATRTVRVSAARAS